MSISEELKSCPFCGGTVELRTSRIPRSTGYRIPCDACGFHMTRIGSDLDESETKSALVTAWNTRASLPPSGEAGEVPLPTYGSLSWDQVGRDVMEAQTGRRVPFDFGTIYPGHVMTGINFNSLARVIEKYRALPTPQPTNKPVAWFWRWSENEQWSLSDHRPNMAPFVRPLYDLPVPAGEVRVKPLEWVGKRGDWHADTVVGQYAVGKVGARYVAMLRFIDGDEDRDMTLLRDSTLDEAKSAAQADYRQRILSALLPREAEKDAFAHDEGRLVMLPVAYATRKAIQNIRDNPKLYHYLPVNGDATRGEMVTLFFAAPLPPDRMEG